MITKITLNNVASYTSESSLETDKEVNLIYGLNGSGKTVLSNYLRDINAIEYHNSVIEGFDPNTQKILVYNQAFVQENFYESETQKGVFNLAQENKEALVNILSAETKRDGLIDRLGDDTTGAKGKLMDKKNEIDKILVDAQNNIWNIKTKFTGGDRIFDKAGFLDGLKGSRVALFSYLRNISPDGSVTTTIENIRTSLLELDDDAVSRVPIPAINISEINIIERNSIFQEVVVGSDQGAVSGLIKQLNNSDWVKKGIKYMSEAGGICPFCQENTITDSLAKEIIGYFDETYEKNVDELKSLLDAYKDFKSSHNMDNYSRDFYDSSQGNELQSLHSNFMQIVDNNLRMIEKKIDSPSLKVQLIDTDEVVKQINDFISARNAEIEAFNKRLENKIETIDKLKKDFWQILRGQYDEVIARFITANNKLKSELEMLVADCADIESRIKEQDNIISENQKNVTNIDKTIESINKNLLDFGIQGFSIKKHDDYSYRIKRDYETSDPIFKTLSEGEKTVISFLYFLELCTGKESQDDTKEKIIVIDDPISSLSHMYIFNVAQLIKHLFTNKNQEHFIQCFVLTHSLYFYHELVGSRPQDHHNYFRITKQCSSKIDKLGHADIQNEYEVYWQIVKTATQENMPLVANAMRNIIEYFFGFMKKSNNLNEILQKNQFSDNKFQSFCRYIDRESHSDITNIYDFKEFNLENFKSAFQLIFEVAGYIEHYTKYMGDN